MVAKKERSLLVHIPIDSGIQSFDEKIFEYLTLAMEKSTISNR
jgi:hypothetical protein